MVPITPEAVTLRPAILDDAGAVAELLVQLYHTEVPDVLHGPHVGQVQLFRHLVEHELAGGIGGRYVAADTSGQIVGSASLRSLAHSAEGILPTETLKIAFTTIGVGDTLRLIGSALRASFTSDVTLGFGECYIYSVVVDQAARKRGIGAAMMGQLEDVARSYGAHTALLRVVASNDPARRLYLRLGYRVISRTPHFLDWITFPTELMRKDLV